MRLVTEASDLRDLQKGAARDVLGALKAAVAGATEYAKQRMREAIRARTTSTRLPNIIGSRTFPAGARLALKPAGLIYPRGRKAEMILRQLAEGATITVKRKRALAIPVHNMRDSNGALLPPAAFPGLFFIPSARRDGVKVGVLALKASRTARGGGLRARDRRMQASVSRSRVQPGVGEDATVMFILVRTVRLPKAFDPEDIMRSAESLMPRLFAGALADADARRATVPAAR
jgi:hypothetical protein